MHWVVDDPATLRTMSACPHTALDSSGQHLIGRFSRSNVLAYWHDAHRFARGRQISSTVHALSDRPDRYVYPIGTAMMPSYWAGYAGNAWGFADLFALIPSAVISDLKLGRALLIIDSLNEGFHDPQIYQYLHQRCDTLGISPCSVAYVTSNLSEAAAYARWSAQLTDRLLVLDLCHWQYQYRLVSEHTGGLTWAQHLAAKSASTKLYSCLNRLSRQHREYLVLRLLQDGLLQQGLVSHGRLHWDDWADVGISEQTLHTAQRLLPLTVDIASDSTEHTALAFHAQPHLDSWISLITETQAMDEPDTCYISEKTFKPINALQPFMILGHAGTLRHLETLGYETFESALAQPYDHLDFFGRVDAILANLWHLRAMRDRQGWLEQLRPALERNRQVLLAHDFFDSTAADSILAWYQGD